MIHHFSLLLGIAIVTASVADAQLTRAYVSGVVTDSSGGVIAGVKVKITARDTGATRAVLTNEAGVYRFAAVEPGTYDLEYWRDGFAAASVEGVRVSVASEVVRNQTLLPAATATTVDVHASEAPLAKASATVEQTLGSSTLERLPLGGNRDITNLMALAPTAVRTPPQAELTYTAGGQRTGTAAFLADGASNKSYWYSFPWWRPIPEGISEFQVQSQSYSSEFGRGPGVTVMFTTRSGSNEFHGSVWDYYSADWLAAARLGDKRAGVPGTRFSEHQAGVSAGGPVFKNRTFFFALFQADPWREGASARNSPQITIPTPAGYAALSQVPLAPGQTSENRQAILQTIAFLPDVHREVRRYDRISTLPIGGVPVEFGLTSIPAANPREHYSGISRIDHRFRDRNFLTFRYSTEQENDTLAYSGLASFSNPNFGARFASSSSIADHFVSGSYTRIVSASVVNELRVSFTRIRSGAGLRSEPAPFVNIISNNFAFGPIQSAPYASDNDEAQVQDILTWQRGRHSLKAGADITRLRSVVAYGSNLRGTWTFLNFVDILNNRAFSFAQRYFLSAPEVFQTQQSYFFQDDWKATSALTLNLGLRYQTAGVPFGMFGATTPELLAAGSLPPVRRDTNDWAPRFGFAWNPRGGRTVLRGGFGLAQVQQFGPIDRVRFNYPMNATAVRRLPDTANLYPNIPAKPASLPLLSPRVDVFVNAPPDTQNPATHFWSLTVQRQLGASQTLEAGYIGNRSYHLLRGGERNPAILTAEQAALVRAGGSIPGPDDRRLNPAWTSRETAEYSGSSRYHAAYIRFDRRLSRGLTFGVNYTFSGAWDEGDSYPQDFFNYAREYARAAVDRPHRLALHYVWALPGKHRVIGGWQLAGYSEWQSGEPFTITTGVDSNGDGRPTSGPTNDRPDWNPSGRIELDPVTHDWRSFQTPLNGTGVFVAPTNAAGQLLSNTMPFGGSLGRNTFRGPRYANTNLSLLKEFLVTERLRVELRATWMNFFNQRAFRPPVSVMNDVNFGSNFSNPDSRTTLLGLKVRF